MNKPKLSDRIGKFTTIPNSVIRLGEKLGTDALVLFLILRYHSDDNDVSFPSYDTIQKESGLTRRRIAEAVRVLETFQLLERKKRFGSSTIYALKLPPISNDAVLLENDTVVQGVDSISNDAELSVVQGVDTNKTHLTRPTQLELAPNGARRTSAKIKGDPMDGILYYAEKNGGKPDLYFLKEHLRPLGQAFIQAAGNEHTPARFEESKWCKILGEWYELHYTPQQITRAVEKMRLEGLTIGGPESVTKTARDVVNENKPVPSTAYVEVYE